MKISVIKSASDARGITEIYRYHVANGVGTFEISVPDVSQMQARIQVVAGQQLPYLVAHDNEEVVGFAYAHTYYGREAYQPTVENSVYVRHGHQGRGIGKTLMSDLIEQCAQLGRKNMIAVIGGGEHNQGSVRLHTSLGFQRVGLLPAVGEKFGQPQDVLLMMRRL